MSRISNIDGYSYYINEESDEDDIQQDSSDEDNLDEIGVFLHGTADQKRRALKSLTGDEASSSDDDFEKLMQGELEAKVKALEHSWRKLGENSTSQECESTEVAGTSKPDRLYDDVYFDSDDGKDNKKRKVLTDDELLYDPHADEEDQKWVDKRMKRHSQTKTGDGVKKSRVAPRPNGSNAVLNCPACMTTLCMDCQRHAIYENQYRAMFVMNCNVKKDELLHYKPKKKKQFKRHRKQQKETAEDSEIASSSFTRVAFADKTETSDAYHPVNCSNCDTEVAVYDSDEIYHFFNVLTSYA